MNVNDSTLILGDCIEKLKEIKTDSIDLIVTDPPYNLGNFMRGRSTNLKKMRGNSFYDAGWDDLDYQDWVSKMNNFFLESGRVLKKNGSVIVFMSLLKIETLVKLAEENGFYYKTTGIWHKTNPMPRNMNLHFINSVEGWVYFTNKTKTGTYNNGNKAIHDFIESSLTSKSEKKYGLHPTQKPENVIEHFIYLLSNKGDTVLDPFMGSGTTGVVARKLNRNFIGIELNETYFNIAHKRVTDIIDTEESLFNLNLMR